MCPYIHNTLLQIQHRTENNLEELVIRLDKISTYNIQLLHITSITVSAPLKC